MNSDMKVQSPWVLYYKAIVALFGKDEDIKIVYDNDNTSLKIYVEGSSKAEALAELLPKEKTFANVTLYITVIPANSENKSKAELVKKAFKGNPVFDSMVSSELFGSTQNYCLFKNEVVQYVNDSLADANGLRSTLYQELAKEILGEERDLHFCTAPSWEFK